MKMIFCFLCTFVLALPVFAKTSGGKGGRKAASMQMPLQQSVAGYRAVLDFLAKDSGLGLLSIRALKMSGSSGKVELVTNDGKCTAYPIEIVADEMGLNPTAKLMINALAACD